MNTTTRYRLFAFSLALALAFLLLSSISEVSAISYPYSNYYGPSDSAYFKETRSIDQKQSRTISSGDYFESTSSSSSERMTVEKRTPVDTSKAYFAPKSRYYDDYSYYNYYYTNPTNTRYYMDHFADFQYPVYSQKLASTGYRYKPGFDGVSVRYIGGDDPRKYGFENYYDDYYYKPAYDWHTSYYVYPY